MILVHSRINRVVRQVIDGAVGCIAFLLAYFVRDALDTGFWKFQMSEVAPLERFWIFFPLISILGPFILFRLNFYNLTLGQRIGNIVNLSLQGGLVIFIILVIAQFLFQIPASRAILVLFVPTYSLLIFGREMVSRSLRAQRARRNRDLRNMLVVTDANDLNRWSRRMRLRPEFGFRVCHTLPLDDFDLDSFIDYLHQHSVQLVVFDCKKGEISKIMEGIRACEDEGIETWFSTSFFKTQITEPQVESFNQQTFLIFRATPDSSWELFLKEMIDRFGALVLILLLSPLMVFSALLIRFTSPGPVFFRQQRSGHYGKPFVMYKFRSMVSNAEQRKKEIADLNEMSGPVFKVTSDPRITPVGHFLRRTSLDELPQLFNVLKGEMSLVGPRPLPVDETLAISENAQRRRLSVKPGITCLWQVGGRSEVSSFAEWVKLDLEYIDNWSLWLDIKILFRTPWAVFFGKGAK